MTGSEFVNLKVLARYCARADRFETSMVENTEKRLPLVEAYSYYTTILCL